MPQSGAMPLFASPAIMHVSHNRFHPTGPGFQPAGQCTGPVHLKQAERAFGGAAVGNAAGTAAPFFAAEVFIKEPSRDDFGGGAKSRHTCALVLRRPC